MSVHLTIKNYRCFVSPVTIEIGKGFTAFVGVNNAGKSTIMRFLLEMRGLFNLIQNNNALAGSLAIANGFGNFAPIHVVDPQEIFSNLNINGLEFWFDFANDEGNEQTNTAPVTKVAVKVQRNFNWTTELYNSNGQLQLRDRNDVVLRNDHVYMENQFRADLTKFRQVTQIFANTLYIGPFRNTINVGAKTDYLDIQIGDAFIKQFRELKTGPSKIQSTSIQNLTENIKNIFEFDSLDIIPSADNSSLHFTVNGKPYKQHELGSGLAQFIVVFANASIKRPQLILIDEPELNLHPRLQLDFVTTLGSYAEYGVWFSTHNVGLARSSAERVYSVVRRGDGDSIIRPLEGTPRLAEFLGEMSFSSHKELGFEKLLLVEGSTEVKVIQQFLRKMGKDHRIVLLPMNGRIPQAEEVEEILRITTKVAAIIDSERSSQGQSLEKKRQEFFDLCKSKGIECLVLERRATENYFSDAAIKAVFGTGYRALGPYELLCEVQPHWGKSDNWKLAGAMQLNELKTTDLGLFLELL